MSVKYIQHKHIDKALWDQRVEMAPNGLPYAYSWYLDIVCNQQWDALVSNEYEWLMPLPWNRKIFGIAQLYQPMLGQQLGIIGSNVTKAITNQFLLAIPKKFRFAIINLNEKNPISSSELPLPFEIKARRNIILDLSADYENLHLAYSKSLKKRLRKATAYHQISKSKDANLVTSFYKNALESKVNFGQKNYTMATHLFQTAIEHKKGQIYLIHNLEKELVGCGFFLISHKRIINLFGATNENGKNSFAMHLLLDAIIREFAAKPLLFDFEGSEIEGIAQFFKSFGSSEVFYPQIKYNHLPSYIKWLKARRSRN